MKTRGFKQLQKFLINLHKSKTLRRIAKENYDNKVNHGVIDRCIKGIEPKDLEIRKALKLPLIEEQLRNPETGQYMKKSI